LPQWGDTQAAATANPPASQTLLLTVVQLISRNASAEPGEVLEGVITAIAALGCRFPSSEGGRPIPRSGFTRQVQQARGWTGDVDASEGLILGFVIDLNVDP
jgi:hypothetical protein